MTKKQATKQWRVFMDSAAYGAPIVTADRYELAKDDDGFGYILFFVGDEEIAFFPVIHVLGVVPFIPSSHV